MALDETVGGPVTIPSGKPDSDDKDSRADSSGDEFRMKFKPASKKPEDKGWLDRARKEPVSNASDVVQSDSPPANSLPAEDKTGSSLLITIVVFLGVIVACVYAYLRLSG